ncbi:hypothetical protein B5E62_13550 [Lachnoclostridium sp. An118]|nr:hypothetical protein B5E62_13550 [Lachnoclostridium sp. An118]
MSQRESAKSATCRRTQARHRAARRKRPAHIPRSPYLTSRRGTYAHKSHTMAPNKTAAPRNRSASWSLLLFSLIYLPPVHM